MLCVITLWSLTLWSLTLWSLTLWSLTLWSLTLWSLMLQSVYCDPLVTQSASGSKAPPSVNDQRCIKSLNQAMCSITHLNPSLVSLYYSKPLLPTVRLYHQRYAFITNATPLLPTILLYYQRYAFTTNGTPTICNKDSISKDGQPRCNCKAVPTGPLLSISAHLWCCNPSGCGPAHMR